MPACVADDEEENESPYSRLSPSGGTLTFSLQPQEAISLGGRSSILIPSPAAVEKSAVVSGKAE